MHSPKLALHVASVLFALICIAHVVRLISHVSLIVADRVMPAWISGAAAIICAALAIWMWVAATPARHPESSAAHA